MPYPTGPAEVSDTVPTDNPDVVGTPEGDNEFAPDQVLPAGGEPAPERPRGNEPHPSQPIRPAQS